MWSSDRGQVALAVPCADRAEKRLPLVFRQLGVVVHGVLAEDLDDRLVATRRRDALGKVRWQRLAGAVQVALPGLAGVSGLGLQPGDDRGQRRGGGPMRLGVGSAGA